MNKSRHLAWLAIAACAALLGLSRTATAGLPMTCHPLDAGDAPLLPWGRDGWRSPAPGYELGNLTRDTLRLLDKEAPILPRMENIRRATLYAIDRPAVADQLLRAVIARAAAGGPGDRLAWFDAAYMIETFRQAGRMEQRNALARVSAPVAAHPDLRALDGYRMLGALQELQGESAELEFARGLMMRDIREHRHLRRAAELAPKGTDLARNLANFQYWR